MDSNFKFISKEQYNCIENVLATLMNTWNKEYALMFAKNWGFTMLPSDKGEDDLIGYRIGGGEYNVWECLDSYHNIETVVCESEDSTEQIDILNEELAAGKPVILQIDGFYTPWKDVYHKYHFIHYCLVVSKDDLDDSYGCIDPYANSLINPLPKENLIIGNAKCITLKMKSIKERKIDWKYILADAVDIILTKEGDISGICGIKALAERIKRHFGIAKEIEGYEEMIWLAPIVFRISDIGARRLNFAESLISLETYTGIKALGEFAKRVEKAGWEWRRIRRMIVTAAGDTHTDYSLTLSNKIREVAQREEMIANDMAHFIKT